MRQIRKTEDKMEEIVDPDRPGQWEPEEEMALYLSQDDMALAMTLKELYQDIARKIAQGRR